VPARGRCVPRPRHASEPRHEPSPSHLRPPEICRQAYRHPVLIGTDVTVARHCGWCQATEAASAHRGAARRQACGARQRLRQIIILGMKTWLPEDARKGLPATESWAREQVRLHHRILERYRTELRQSSEAFPSMKRAAQNRCPLIRVKRPCYCVRQTAAFDPEWKPRRFTRSTCRRAPEVTQE
jgi:hypothetical protein